MSKTYARIISAIFLVCVQIFSMSTSYSFFAASFKIQPIVAGLIGLLLLDGAFIAWLAIRMNLAESRGQIAAATIGAIVGFCGSAASTYGFMTISSSGLTDSLTSQLNTAFGAIGVIHVALATMYQLSSREAAESIAAANRKAAHTAEIESIRAETDRQVIERLRKELPSLAAIGSERLYHDLLAEYANPLIASNVNEGNFDIKAGRNVCQFDQCHNSLDGKRRGTKYCSDSCKQAAYKSRAAA